MKQIDANARYAVYTRVSNDQQMLENQEAQLRAYIERNNLKVTDWYRDEGESGAIVLRERPEGRRLARDAERKKFEHVLVNDISRLGRTLRDSLITVEDWYEDYNIGFLDPVNRYDTSTSHGRILFVVLMLMAQEEREQILKRTRSGIERVVLEGKWPGGPPPYGWRINEDGYLEEHPFEAKIVRQIFDWYESGKSTVQIADLLTAQGVPTPMVSRGKKSKQPYSNRWLPSNISKMLRAVHYLGEFWFRKRTVERKRGHVVGHPKTPKDQQTIILIPALITPDQMMRCARRCEENIHHVAPCATREYLLRGLVKCACGRACTGNLRTTRHGKKIACYSCVTKKQRGGSCSCPRVRADILEERVKSEIRDWLNDPGPVLLQLKGRLETATTVDDQLFNELRDLLGAIREKEIQVKETAKLISTQPHLQEVFLPELENRTRELRALQDHQADLQERCEQPVNVDATMQEMAGLIVELQSAMQDAEENLETWRQIIRRLVSRIILTGEDRGGRFLEPKIQLVVRYPQAQNGCARSQSTPSELDQIWTHPVTLDSASPE